MSSPVSTKLSPVTMIDPRIRRKYLIFYLMQLWLSLLPGSWLLFWAYFQGSNSILLHNILIIPLWVDLISFPLILLILYAITVIWSAVITKIVLRVLNTMHPVKEGLFYRSETDLDYIYWNRRNMSRLFLFWLLNSVPFEIFSKRLSFRFFGLKIGKNVQINHTWISPELISIGDNALIGQGAHISSFTFEKDKIIIAKIQIGEDVRIGPQTVILPGTQVEDNVIIDAGSFIEPFSLLEKNSFYHGTPAVKIEKSETKEQK